MSLCCADLRESIEVFNENRALLRQIYDMRKADNPPLTGTECMYITTANLFMDKRDANELLKKTIEEELTGREAKHDTDSRLMVVGSENDDIQFLEMVEGFEAVIVTDDHCTGSRYFWNLVSSEGDLLRAIAKRYLDKVPSSFMSAREERFKHTIEMAKRFDVEAAIVFVLKFCDAHMFDTPELVEELKTLGLPVLYLEWEHSLSGLAQLKTRIEAFLEIVGGTE